MKYLAIAALSALAPALAAAQHGYSKAEIALMAKARVAVLHELRDPDSARFGATSVYNSGATVCGEITAKNGYGGYAQTNLFAYLAKTGQVVFMMDPTRSQGESYQIAALFDVYCPSKR
jgi:hypothetical protein